MSLEEFEKWWEENGNSFVTFLKNTSENDSTKSFLYNHFRNLMHLYFEKEDMSSYSNFATGVRKALNISSSTIDIDNHNIRTEFYDLINGNRCAIEKIIEEEIEKEKRKTFNIMIQIHDGGIKPVNNEIYSPRGFVLKEDKTITIDTRLSLSIPKDYTLLIHSMDKDLVILNNIIMGGQTLRLNLHVKNMNQFTGLNISTEKAIASIRLIPIGPTEYIDMIVDDGNDGNDGNDET